MVQGKRRSRDTVGFLSERDKLNMSNKIYLKKNYVKRNLWMKQDREHLEMHLKIVAEERELNKKKIRRIGYLKFVVLSITKFLLSYLFWWDYEILNSVIKVF